MDSRSSSNTASTTSKLTNSYFFYGTHPLKVPTGVIHSNSANHISATSDQNTHHLSLNSANSHNRFSSNSELSTTQSLRNFPQSYRDEDAISEVFEDAVECFDDDHNENNSHRRSSLKQYETPAIDLYQMFNECQEITRLFFGNHLNEALKRTKAHIISYLHAAMTFNHNDIETAIQALRHTSNMTKTYEPYRPWIPFSLSAKPVMTEYELHAKLVYAEALLIRALLTFIQDQSLFSFISGALKIKECHDIFLKLSKHNDPSKFSSSLSHEHFESGIRFGTGAFNLMISNLPQRIIRYLEFAGFSGNREFGLNELKKSATSNGLRALFSALLILSYHTFVTQLFGNADGDFETCHMLVESYLRIYPNNNARIFI
ncbi:unnamed protein product [Rotaria sp. Silwood2]|nr:unnamed protein product [Rotaria sp. Silwood2]CAF4417633.1 unnamed protein product [Rotaria sp. Silwood2]